MGSQQSGIGDVCLPPNGFITIGKTGACEKGRGGETKAQRSHLGALGLRPAPATAVRGMCGDTFLVQQTAFPAAPTAREPRGEPSVGRSVGAESSRGGEESGRGGACWGHVRSLVPQRRSWGITPLTPSPKTTLFI